MTGENATTSDPGSGDGARQTDEPWTVSRDALEGMALGVAISGAVASRTGENVLDLDPLAEVVDVDALEALWRGDRDVGWTSDARVTFRYMDHEVTVTGERLRLVPLAD